MIRRMLLNEEQTKNNVQYVKSLISHGAEYIDTGIAVTENTVIRAYFYDREFNRPYENYFGTPLNTCGCIKKGGENSLGFPYRGATEYANYIDITPPFTANVIIDTSNNTFELNGVRKTYSNYSAVFSEKSMWIFAKARQNGTLDTPGAFRLYSFSIFESGENKINLLPAIDQDGIPCLYDTVSETFFYNLGTGEFGYETLEGEVINE